MECRSGFRRDYLDYRNTLTARFLMIASIFIFHAGLFFGFPVPNNGHTCVAVFFFLSGYGLEYSLTNKPGYMRTFLQKRALGLLIQYWLIMMFCAALTGVAYLSFQSFMQDADKYLFEYVNWYILELLVFYVIFFISAMFREVRWRYLFVLVTTIASMYILAENFDTNLYLKSGLVFIVGMAWYRYKDRIDAFLTRYYALIIIPLTVLLLIPERNDVFAIDMIYTGITALLLVVVGCMVLMADLRKRWYIPLLALIVGGAVMFNGLGTAQNIEGASMLFLAGLSCVIYQIPSLCKAMVPLGSMSLELFLLHYITFKWTSYYIDDLLVIMILSTIITLIISYTAYVGVGRIMKAYNKGVDRLCTEQRPPETAS